MFGNGSKYEFEWGCFMGIILTLMATIVVGLFADQIVDWTSQYINLP